MNPVSPPPFPFCLCSEIYRVVPVDSSKSLSKDVIDMFQLYLFKYMIIVYVLGISVFSVNDTIFVLVNVHSTWGLNADAL